MTEMTSAMSDDPRPSPRRSRPLHLFVFDFTVHCDTASYECRKPFLGVYAAEASIVSKITINNMAIK
jgi:hypothetical protein